MKSQIVEPSDPPAPEVQEAVPQAPTRPADELYESFIEYSPHGNRLGGANLEIGYAPTDLTRRVIPWNEKHFFKLDQAGNGMPVSIYAHPHHVEIWLRVNRWVKTGECLIKVLVLPPHLAGLEELREAQASLFETVENRIDDPKEGPRYWAGTPISIERRPRYLRVRLGILGPDDLVCIGRQPALYSDQNAAARMKDSRIQSQGPSLTTVKETLEQVLLAPKDLSAPNYVSQLFESEGKLPTAPAVPSVEWRREEEQREYERERREAKARIEADRKEREESFEAWREEERKRSEERLAELARREEEREKAAAEQEAELARREEERRASLPWSSLEPQERWARRKAETEAERMERQARTTERIMARIYQQGERERELQREERERERRQEERQRQQEELQRQQEERQRQQEEVARRQAAREKYEAQRLEEADERNELFQAAQTALVREVLSCAVTAGFWMESDPEESLEPHKEQLLAQVQRDFGPDSNWNEVLACLVDCGYASYDGDWLDWNEFSYAFYGELWERFQVESGSTFERDLGNLLESADYSDVFVSQIAKTIASHMPLADLADIARSESEQGTTE